MVGWVPKVPRRQEPPALASACSCRGSCEDSGPHSHCLLPLQVPCWLALERKLWAWFWMLLPGSPLGSLGWTKYPIWIPRALSVFSCFVLF